MRYDFQISHFMKFYLSFWSMMCNIKGRSSEVNKLVQKGETKLNKYLDIETGVSSQHWGAIRKLSGYCLVHWDWDDTILHCQPIWHRSWEPWKGIRNHFWWNQWPRSFHEASGVYWFVSLWPWSIPSLVTAMFRKYLKVAYWCISIIVCLSTLTAYILDASGWSSPM